MDISKLTESQMEAILGPDSENKAFETFIFNYIQKDPEAESMLKVIKQKDPESFALKLAHYLGNDHDIHTRQACAELLGKLLLTDDDGQDLCTSTWRSLSVSTQSTIKCILLDRMNPEEESGFIVHELSKTVFELAVSLLPHNNWPELLPFLFQCLSSTNNSSNLLKENVFLILNCLVRTIGDTIISPCVKPLHSLFRNSLNDNTLDLDVRIAATKAVIGFIVSVPSPNEKERFQDLLPGMMSTLTDSTLSSGGEAKDVLEDFIELAKYEPRFLRTQLVEAVHTVFEIAEAESLEEGTRHLAVEFFMTLVEAREKAPGMMKRLPFFISRCFALLLNLLLNFKDDPAWHSAETVFNTEATISQGVGFDYLHRFSHALGDNSIGHTAKEQLCAYLAAPEWEKNYVALVALGCVCKPRLKEIIKDDRVMEMVLNCFQHPHPQVRWAACMHIGALLRFCPRHFQEQYRNQVFLALAVAMEDFHPRVQACSMVAFKHLGGMDMPETLILHLDGIVNKLLVFLQNDRQMVVQQALAAIAAIAQSAKEHFHTYYDTVMPRLTTVMRNAYLKSNVTLCTIAMEFISLVGVAVGKEKFRDDAKQVTDVFMSLQGQQVKADDHATSYMLSACSRVCVCIGKDFLPYMSTVMPILIQYAQLEPDTTISTKSKYYEIFELEDILIEGFNRPGVLEVKARAYLCLSRYADTLKEDFQPWIPQAVSIFVPLLKFCTDDLIRRCAVEAMPILLSSIKMAVEKGIGQGESESYFKELSDYIILSLVEALHEERVIEICGLMVKMLDDCLQQICQPLLNEGQLQRIVDEVKHVITESSNRKRELMERAKTEDFDAEEEELLREEKEQEDKIVKYVGRILVTLIKTFKAAFLPFFDELPSYLIPTMWGKDMSHMTAQERTTWSFIFDCILEDCPEAALKYCDVFLPLLLDASSDENPTVRQNALYGLGLYAEDSSRVFKPFVTDAISTINVVIMHFRAHEPENEKAYDNAVSALAKICEFHRESIISAQVIPIWLNCLPIKGDLPEAKYVHDLLCSMVERLDMELIGLNYEHCLKIISVFAEVLCSENNLATEETKNRMINALGRLKKSLPPATLESTLAYLLPQHEMELRSILSPEKDANY